MNLLIVAATEAEIAPLIGYLDKSKKPGAVVLISGVGMMAATYSLAKHLGAYKYDLVIQAGVAGSYDRDIAPGDLLFVTTDQYGDLGAEDHDNYLDIFELGLLEKNGAPFTDGRLPVPLLPVHEKISLRRVSGLTVNTVSGSEQTIRSRMDKYACQVESMEGVALHYVCSLENVPFAQIRAISNYVTPRDKSQWKMMEAIANLNYWLIDFIEAMQK